MVLNSSVVVTVANVSANVCQYIACNPEWLPTDQVLRLLFCVPLQQFGRLALSLWTYLCYNPNGSSYWSSDQDTDDDDDSHSD